MTDQQDPPRPEDVPIESGRRSLWERVSIIWLIPIIALVVALGAAYRNYADRGPVIEIAFENAAGITADETELRYRDIGVGVVEGVSFSDDLGQVVVSVRLEKEIARFVDSEARFWVVRPEVSARGVSGLDTVLSGVYIAGAWDSTAGEWSDRFEGLESVPLLEANQQGTSFVLRSSDGLPSADTPILYKGVEVGMVDAARISEDGTGVEADAVIYEPHTSLVSTSTRFWDISGFNFTLGASGARLNFTSFASLIQGGITFDTLGSGGTEFEEGAEFELFADEESARDDFLVEGEGAAVDVAMIFDENLSGLSSGAAVELGGLRVGEIASITGIVNEERFGDTEVRLLATARINPGRIGLAEGADPQTLFAYLDDRIAEGMRARLTNASILTGGLKVELVELPGAPEATLDREAEPYPQIPTAPAEITDVTATAQGALQRVSDLPIEETMQSAIDLMNQATALIGNQDMQETPTELRGLLAAVRGVAESDQVQGLPDQVSGLVSDLQETSASLNRVVATIENEETAGKLTDAIETVGVAADALPGLIEETQGVIANAGEVPLGDLSAQLSELLAAAETLLGQTQALVASDDLQAAPTELRGVLASARGLIESEETQAIPGQVSDVLTDLQVTGATLNRVVSTLETERTVARLSDAIDTVGQVADSLPPLLEETQAAVANAGDVPFQELSAQVSALLTAAQSLVGDLDTFVASEDVQGVPTELRGVLASARGVVENEAVQGLPEQVNTLVASLQQSSGTLNRLLSEIETQDAAGRISRALADVEAAADGLPELVNSARAIVDQAGEVPLDTLAERASDLIDSADRLIDQEETRALPAELNASLQSLRETLQEFREGGLVENTNATLASARSAATAIEQASQTLPALSAELRSVATQAGQTLSTYGDEAPFTRDTRAAIRQVTEAAEAIERLARTIERNPNSLILGR